MSIQTRTQNMVQKFFKKHAPATQRQHLTAAETDNNFLVGTRSLDDSPRDRQTWDRAQILEDCLDAWRFNPLARRIVELTSQYVVGGGMVVQCPHAATQTFLQSFWQERLNRMDVRLVEMCDELTRSGNLFVLLSTDQAGMSYLRMVPAAEIATIESAPNDVEQPRQFITRGDVVSGDPTIYMAYDANLDSLDENGRFQPVMLHYAINRPAGAQWGEPDLAPLLRWLSRYAAWLEDRVRLNRFRNAFLYVVKARFASESARQARQLTLAANPPAPGSILVTDESEEWSVISPKLEALNASTDGLAVKKMIAAGAGVPLHFLAEPESSTRTTAEASGSPTYRHYEQRQRFFQWLLMDLLKVVLARRHMLDGSVQPDAALAIHAADISARDNVSLAQAGVDAASVLEKLVDKGLIEPAEMLRVVYRFMGETGDTTALMGRASGQANCAENDRNAGGRPGSTQTRLDLESEALKSTGNVD